MKKIQSNIFKFLLYNLLIVFFSARFFLKFFNIYFLILFVLIINVFLYFLLFRDINPILRYFNWKVIIILITIGNFFIYPLVDARKFQPGKGSAGDDALILSANTLKTTGKLYDVMVGEDTPTSPGPGWVILNSPFVLLNLYFLFTVFYIFIVCITLSYTFNKTTADLFLLLCSTSMVFWELIFNGHDIFPLSAMLFVCSILIFRYMTKSNNIILIAAIALLTGVISTSRIIFIFFPFLLSLFLWKFNKKNSVLLFFIATVVNVSLHLYYYSVNTVYQPLHLFNKALTNIDLPLIISGITGFFIMLFFQYKNLTENFQSWNKSIFTSFLIIFFPISVGDLIKNDFNFQSWEGANYIIPVIPFFFLYIILGLNKFLFKNDNPENLIEGNLIQ